ncbi:uncharacterized protein LOC110689054 [Chenopodium quinoa]|uniref:uncharacterized protein LOC110689054 n=1 Tax=Chenopodium quinoa TaxID=63459 RepID=UPI000B771238|nr:uncharacterized protein LOC110689054 [Chenopodium quinoa]
MSPKTATLSLALLALTLTQTLSFAHALCPGFASIPEILNQYELPPSLFPDDVQSYNCHSLPNDSLSLTINLKGACTVTKALGPVKNILECQPTISATISTGKLSDVKGVTVQLYVEVLPGIVVPFGPLMTITGAIRVFDEQYNLTCLKFTSNEGDSPCFPYSSFPKDPTKCDISAANTNQDIPLLLA